MARKYENECVDCGLPCLGSACPNRDVLHITCDKCDVDILSDAVYIYNGKDYCESCILEALVADGTIEKEV